VKVKVFIGTIYSLKSNTYFWGTVMFVQDGFLYLIVTKYKLTVWGVWDPGDDWDPGDGWEPGDGWDLYHGWDPGDGVKV
jgi:hypothetical protein